MPAPGGRCPAPRNRHSQRRLLCFGLVKTWQ